MRRVAGLVAVLAIAGCGGGGTSAKDYRAKADAVCARVKAQRDRIPPAQDVEQLKATLQTTIAINTEALRRLQALKPPGDLKDEHDVIVTRLQETLKLQQQALKTDPKGKAMESINIRAGQAHTAMVAAARSAKLVRCTQL
jgi:hypothetical protein